jgi:hypothetical protein
MARERGIDAKTVKEYYQILVDTLLGTMLARRVAPCRKAVQRVE